MPQALKLLCLIHFWVNFFFFSFSPLQASRGVQASRSSRVVSEQERFSDSAGVLANDKIQKRIKTTKMHAESKL